MTGRKPTSTARQDASSSGRRPVVNSGSSWVATMQGEPRRLHTWSRERSLAIVWSTWAPLTSAVPAAPGALTREGCSVVRLRRGRAEPARVQPFGEVVASQPERHNLVPIDRHRPGPAVCS
jgi:hypothetical protein